MKIKNNTPQKEKLWGIQQKICSWKRKSPVWFLLFSLFLAVLIELFGFQLDEFMLKAGQSEPISLDLTALPEYDGTGIPLSPDMPSYSFNQLSIKAKRVTISTKGAPRVLDGLISLCDEASAYKTQGAGHFLVNPGGAMSSATVRLESHGLMSRLRVTFSSISEPVWITSVVFNQPEFHISWLRLLLFTTVAFGILLIWKYELYTSILDIKKRSHQFLIAGSLLLCILLCGLLLYELSPSHTYLKGLPDQKAMQQYRNDGIEDAYAQQLDAFEKGQLALDLAVNPKLASLDNVYDTGEREKKEVEFHWDRAYYKGAYYSYFGLAPLFTVYYPVYWLTGQLPTELLCTSLLAIFAVLGTFAAVYVLISFFRLRANLLLCLLGVPAVTFGGMLYMLQSNMNFYYYPILSGLGWLTVFLSCSFGACMNASRLKRGLLFFCSGFSVVMLVLSRPNLLLLAVAFVLPAFLHILFDKERAWKDKFLDVLPFLLPVLIGCIGICWYNYARFGSVTEFGTSYQMTESDIRYNKLTLSFHHFKAMLYHYFAQPLTWKEFFPFLSLNRELCYDFGNYLYQECTGGLLNLPLNLGIFLAGRNVLSRSRKAPLQRATYLLVILGILGLGYINFCLAGTHIRYTCDLALVVSILSLLLILEYASHPSGDTGHMFYHCCLIGCLFTILIGICMIFSNEQNAMARVNPDFYIQVARLLRNW